MRQRGKEDLPVEEHPQPARAAPVAPVAALRTHREHCAHLVRLRHQPEELPARAVSDQQQRGPRMPFAQEPQPAGQVLLSPGMHRRVGGPDGPTQRSSDASVIELEHRQVALGEILGESAVKAARHGHRRPDDHRAPHGRLRIGERTGERKVVESRKDDVHAAVLTRETRPGDAGYPADPIGPGRREPAGPPCGFPLPRRDKNSCACLECLRRSGGCGATTSS